MQHENILTLRTPDCGTPGAAHVGVPLQLRDAGGEDWRPADQLRARAEEPRQLRLPRRQQRPAGPASQALPAPVNVISIIQPVEYILNKLKKFLYLLCTFFRFTVR